ncbi:hypothetical protein Vafri_19302 [Volvox africanus]|nr:hypothetical protein Vafri_19302 [Volvox africanus]
MTSRTNFERLLREKEREVERLGVVAARGGSLSQLSLDLEQLRNSNTHLDHHQSGNCEDQQQDADLDLDPSSEQHQGAFSNHLTNNQQQPTAVVVARPRPKTAFGLTTAIVAPMATATQDRAAVLSGRLSPSFGFGGDGAVAAEGDGDGSCAIWSSVDSEGDCGGYSCCGSYGAPPGRMSGESEGEAGGAAVGGEEGKGASPLWGATAEVQRWFRSEDSSVMREREDSESAEEHNGGKGGHSPAALPPKPTEPPCTEAALAVSAAVQPDVDEASPKITTAVVAAMAALQEGAWAVGPDSALEERAVSYRRLSATVQDAFAVLDAVDGAGRPREGLGGR